MVNPSESKVCQRVHISSNERNYRSALNAKWKLAKAYSVVVETNMLLFGSQK